MDDERFVNIKSLLMVFSKSLDKLNILERGATANARTLRQALTGSQDKFLEFLTDSSRHSPMRGIRAKKFSDFEKAMNPFSGVLHVLAIWIYNGT